ncbi:MAG: AAA family ATPase, partial [Candidatus Binatia bacterium]
MAESGELFARSEPPTRKPPAPLAERMRPGTLDELVGQDHLLGPGRLLRELLEAKSLPSLILWGPPGSGKTTLARILAEGSGAELKTISAVLAGVKDIRETVDEADRRWQREARPTVLFVDEIHRFNKAQQDALLPHVERGTIVLVGATTENPSFEVIRPLLSRARVVTLEPLGDDDVRRLLERALADEERGLGSKRLAIAADALAFLVPHAQGDARRAGARTASRRSPSGSGRGRWTSSSARSTSSARAPPCAGRSWTTA